MHPTPWGFCVDVTRHLQSYLGSLSTGPCSSVEETWWQTPVSSAARASRAFTNPTADAPGASQWVTHRTSFPAAFAQSESNTVSVCCPGPRGERGHALLPHFWLWGWLTVPLRLSGCLQWPFQPGTETGSLLWNFPPWSSYFNYKHHDAGDGIWWGDTRERLCGLFQWCQTIRRWYAVMFNLVVFFTIYLVSCMQICLDL